MTAVNYTKGLKADMEKLALYERNPNDGGGLLRITRIFFDYEKRLFPYWYPMQNDPQKCCHLHLHEKLELLYVIKGEIEFSVAGDNHSCGAGGIIVINPFEPHSGKIAQGKGRTLYYALNIDLRSLAEAPIDGIRERISALIGGGYRYPTELTDSGTLAAVRGSLDAILEHRRSRECSGFAVRQSGLFELAHICLILDALGVPEKNPLGYSRSAEFIQKVITAISGEDLAGVTLEGTAKKLSYNKAYFTTVFRKNFGTTFTDFLNHYKIDCARSMIRGGSRNMNEISIACGFNYYAYFFRRFKEICGMTPVEFAALCDREMRLSEPPCGGQI